MQAQAGDAISAAGLPQAGGPGEGGKRSLGFLHGAGRTEELTQRTVSTQANHARCGEASQAAPEGKASLFWSR